MKFKGTTACFYRRSDGKLIGYTTTGHTGYAQSGSDIVCAAVSALTQTTANGIINILKAPSRFFVDDQDASLELLLNPEIDEETLNGAQLLFKTLVEGLESIQADHPKNVRVIFQERR